MGEGGGHSSAAVTPNVDRDDGNSEITLYPIIHIRPDNITWKSAELSERLEDANGVWFEITPGSEVDPKLQSTMARLGMAPGTS